MWGDPYAAVSRFRAELVEAERRRSIPVYLLDRAGTLASDVAIMKGDARLVADAEALVARALKLTARIE